MKIETIVVGPLQVNCYVIFDEQSHDSVVIDPGEEPGKILRVIEQYKLAVRLIVCTHGHFDHVGAISSVKEKTGAPVVLHKSDLDIYNRATDQAAFWDYSIMQPPEPDRFIAEGDTISIGRHSLSVLHTPGHSPGGISLYGEGIVITGDTVFAGSIGRTDFPGGSLVEMKNSFREIISLPGETKIFPGHGPCSTVQEEKETNFFVAEI